MLEAEAAESQRRRAGQKPVDELAGYRGWIGGEGRGPVDNRPSSGRFLADGVLFWPVFGVRSVSFDFDAHGEPVSRPTHRRREAMLWGPRAEPTIRPSASTK